MVGAEVMVVIIITLDVQVVEMVDSQVLSQPNPSPRTRPGLIRLIKISWGRVLVGVDRVELIYTHCRRYR